MKQIVCILLILFGTGCVVHNSFSQSLRSDEFNNPNLQSFWHLENGNNTDYTFTNGQLVVNGRFNQNLWTDTSAMRFYQVTDQDQFTIETSMVVDYADACSVAGLVIYSPTTKDRQGRDGEWVTLKLYGRPSTESNNTELMNEAWEDWLASDMNVNHFVDWLANDGVDLNGDRKVDLLDYVLDLYNSKKGTDAVLQYQRRESPVSDLALGYVRTQPDYNPRQGVIPIAMRLKRDGDAYEAWFKPDARGDWVSVSKVTNALKGPLEVGFYVGICEKAGAGRLTVSFDHFRVDAPVAPVTLSFTMPSEVSAGEEFTATVNIADAGDLAGVQFDLHFNPAVLEATDVHEGDFLSGAGVFFQVEHFNSVPGEISGIRIARADGVDGDGVLLKVDFKAKAAGVSALEVRSLKLGTSGGTPLPSEVVSTEVAVRPQPDVTGDGKVDILDLVRITRHFGPASAAPVGLDINGDGDIDILDLILLARHLGR